MDEHFLNSNGFGGQFLVHHQSIKQPIMEVLETDKVPIPLWLQDSDLFKTTKESGLDLHSESFPADKIRENSDISISLISWKLSFALTFGECLFGLCLFIPIWKVILI